MPKLHNTTGTVFDGAMSMTYRVADIAQGENITFMQDLPSSYCTYWYTSPTVFTKHDVSGWYPFKIIGRRYTRVSPTGYRETLLWEYDPNTMTTGQDITLIDKFTNYDTIYFAPWYTVMDTYEDDTRAGGNYYLTSLFANVTDSNRKYVSVSGVNAGGAGYCDFQYDGDKILHY